MWKRAVNYARQTVKADPEKAWTTLNVSSLSSIEWHNTPLLARGLVARRGYLGGRDVVTWVADM